MAAGRAGPGSAVTRYWWRVRERDRRRAVRRARGRDRSGRAGRSAQKRRTGRARIIGIVVSVVVVGGVFAFALPRIADYGEVWDVVQTLSWEWVVALVLAALLNLATYGPPLVAALPGISYFRATRVTLASTALSSVAPGGAAVGMATTFAMLRAWGFEGRRAGLAVAVQSVWNQFVILGFPILAIAGLAAQGARNRTLELVAIIGLAAFAAIVVGFAIGLSSERLARRIGDRAARLASRAKALIHKAPVKWNGATFVRFRGEAIELIRRRWLSLTAGDARRAPHGLPRPGRLAPSRRRHARRGDDRRGVRRLDAGPDPRLDPDHAGRRRLRRARSDRRPRRVRRERRRRGRGDADLPLPHRRSDAGRRPRRRGDVEA